MQCTVTHFVEQSMLQTLPFFFEERGYRQLSFTFQLILHFLVWAHIKVLIFPLTYSEAGKGNEIANNMTHTAQHVVHRIHLYCSLLHTQLCSDLLVRKVTNKIQESLYSKEHHENGTKSEK